MLSRLQSALAKANLTHALHPGIRTVQTRLAVSIATLLAVRFTPVFDHPKRISWIIIFYLATILAIALPQSPLLRKKRFRAFRDLLDLVAISLLVNSTGGFRSPWHLLYLFPILSQARYLGPVSAILVAIFSSLLYAIAGSVRIVDSGRGGYEFWLWAAVQIGVALTATNLARMRDRAEANLVTAIEKIDREILANADITQVMRSILSTAMEITNSDVGAVALVEGEKITATYALASPVDTSLTRNKSDESEAIRFVEQYYHRVRKEAKLEWRTRATFPLPDSPGNAVLPANLVPLNIDGTLLGVLGVFSRDRLHYYTFNDVRKLLSMAPLIVMARKNAQLYRDLASRDNENKGRLNLLSEIGHQLRAEQGLDKVFQKVVELVSAELRSEEAALFVVRDAGARLEKVAVAGPDSETTARLKEVERFYKKGESLTGRVFASKQGSLLNPIPRDEDYADVYSGLLPSRETRHYIGVPLLIGGDILGVIRVLNKKAPDYDPPAGRTSLSRDGFQPEDFDLLKLIATQIVSAIRNAEFIESNKYFQNLVYNSPDPIIVVDKLGKIQNFNRQCENIWGMIEKDVLGTSVETYFEFPEDAKQIVRDLRQARDHVIWDRRVRIRDVQGNVIPIRMSATLFLDNAGKEIGRLGVFKDEREVLRQEREKVRLDTLAALRKLAEKTGHDIKHDLGAVLTYVTTLQQQSRGGSTVETYAAIREASNSALGKLQNLLMTASPPAPTMQVVSLKAILQAFEASMKKRAEASRVEFRATYPEDDALVLADADQLRQVFANLFGNSIDAIKAIRATRGWKYGGRINLAMTIAGADILVVWCDNGCGISEDIRTSLFTALFTTKETGSGLGLFISKTILEGHGGAIVVESQEGGGICFRLTLPAFRLAQAQTDTQASHPAHPVPKETRA